METRIIFNGKTYTRVEDMPEDVRQAYRQALAHLADADKNGIPDILEGGAAGGNVIAIQQSSINFNGKEYGSVGEMPAIVRRLFEMAMNQADANRNGIPDALESGLGMQTATSSSAGAKDQPESGASLNFSFTNAPHQSLPAMDGLKKTADALETLLRLLLGAVSFATVAGAIFLMLKMDGGSRSQGGRFYLAIGALVILGAIDSQFRKLVVRRAPFSFGTTEAESRYSLISLLLLLLSGVVLFGAAWLLP
jgi:hypothetical protein